MANPQKRSCRHLLQEAAAQIQAAGRTLLAERATAQAFGLALPTAPTPREVSQAVDLLAVFGGDGTMLRVAREVAGSPTPMMGINLGGLGFLTGVQSQQLPAALEQIWAGRFTLESRSLIEASGSASGRLIHELALNDFVVGRGAAPRLIDLEVSVDDQVLTRYRCDGLIVCTPTGSTAYSLAAGGAVVSPSAEVLTLTPICPHTLSNRSVIVGLDSIIRVRTLSSRTETILTADGQISHPLAQEEVITIRRSSHSVRLLQLAGSSFFETLRIKLNWRGSSVL